MSGTYVAYPEYKDSGVEWLGKIPVLWRTIKFGITNSSAELGGNYLAGEGEEGIPVIKMGNLGRGVVNLNKVERLSINESYDSEHLLKEGDFLFNTRNSLDLVGKVSIWRGELGNAVYNSNVLRIAFHERFVDSTTFMNYLFNSNLGLSQLRLIAKGTTSVAAIYYKELSALIFAFPPNDEQQKIANFLDHETAKIDTLIEKQQQLIKLLKEKRQAVISHAVTKGLNPNAPMRDSGVEWLGEVPEHWLDTEIRYITRQMGGGTPSKERADFWNGNIPWVSPKDMKIDYIDDAQDKITTQAVQESSTKLIPVGSVLIVVRGMILVHSVPVALTQREVTINQDMKALIPVKGVDGEFLLFFMKGLRDFILDLVEESAHGTKCLRSEAFERMKIAIPEFQEQTEIVTQLKEKIVVIDSLIEKAHCGIELLNERRTALISAAVTGKIDVRHFNLEDGEPPEPSNTNNKEVAA